MKITIQALTLDTEPIRRHTKSMATKRTNKRGLAADLRRAIRQSELTPYRIAADAKVDRAVMTRFVNGTRGLKLDTASRICDVLGLALRPVHEREDG